MQPSKKKICKGNYRSGYFKGCGQEKYIKLYGLCSSCVSDWMNDTDLGKLYLEKMTIKASKKVNETKRKESKKQTFENKIKLMSNDEYRAKYLQPVINEIARKIDFGQPCIATGNFGKMAGGHFYSVGSNRTICLNLHNIHIQTFQSNSWKGGDERKYAQGLENIYGKKYLDFVKLLKQTPPLHLTKDDLIRFKEKACEIRNRIPEEKRTPLERLEMRNRINYQLGIYEDKYCFY